MTREAYEEAVRRHFQMVRDSVDQMVRAVAVGDPRRLQTLASELYGTMVQIENLVAMASRPPWTAQLKIAVQPARAAGFTELAHRETLALVLASIFSDVSRFKWQSDVATENDLAIDFDQLFVRFRDEALLPDLFERLAQSLQALLDSPAEEIDSRRVHRALRMMVALLRKNQHGSYFSMVVTLDFVGGVFRHWVYNEIVKLPAVGGLLKAIIGALEETRSKMALTHQRMQSEVQKAKESPGELPSLEYSAPVGLFLEDGGSLPRESGQENGGRSQMEHDPATSVEPTARGAGEVAKTSEVSKSPV